jgi:fatty-acyl-CoA synthase
VAIETAAAGHPAIAAAAAVAMPHARWDERPALFVTLRPGAVEPGDLAVHLQAALPRTWLPDRITVLPALPLGATGKVDKRALRALAASPA